MSYAALHPTEVASLWLLDPGGVWSAPVSELRKVIAETGQNPLMARNEEEFAQIFAFVMSDPPFIPRPMLNVIAQERINNFGLEKRIFEQIAADSLEARVTGLRTPTLIVWGDQDRAIHVATAEILHLMPASQVIILPGSVIYRCSSGHGKPPTLFTLPCILVVQAQVTRKELNSAEEIDMVEVS